MLYKAFVRPLLEHGAAVWDPYQAKYILKSLNLSRDLPQKYVLKAGQFHIVSAWHSLT